MGKLKKKRKEKKALPVTSKEPGQWELPGVELLTAVCVSVFLCLCLFITTPTVCVFYFHVFCVSSLFSLSGFVLVATVLPLTITESQQHVAVIKSKEIGEKERRGEKRLWGDFAQKKSPDG